MTTYDKIAHTVGQAAVGLVGAGVTMPAAHIPTWLMVVALVVISATGLSTGSALARKTQP